MFYSDFEITTARIAGLICEAITVKIVEEGIESLIDVLYVGITVVSMTNTALIVEVR